MNQLSLQPNYTGIDKETPRSLAIAVVIGEDEFAPNSYVSAKKFFKVLHVQYIIEKLLTGFFTCTDINSGLCIKFKVERTSQYVTSLLNQVMTYFGYNNGTNYTIEKYHLLLDKIRKNQDALNQKYDLIFEKDERYNCWYLVEKPVEVDIEPEKPRLQLVPKLNSPNSHVIQTTNSGTQPIQTTIANIDHNYDYFDYLLKLAIKNQQDNTIEFLFPLLNNYVSYSMNDLLGSIESFGNITLLQFQSLDTSKQYKCICQLLNIME